MSAEEWYVARQMVEEGAFWHVMVFVFGAMWGSYCNVCIYRIPFGKSTVHPRSFCFACRGAIPWHRNIPVLSYLLLGGKCGSCKAPYAPRYMLIEVLMGLLFWGIFYKYGAQPVTLVYWFMIFWLVMGTFIDFDWQLLPDRVTIGGIFFGLALSPWVAGMQQVPFALFFWPAYAVLLALLGYGLLWEHREEKAFQARLAAGEMDEDEFPEPEFPPELEAHFVEEKHPLVLHHVHAVVVIMVGLALCLLVPTVVGWEPRWNRLLASISGAALGFSLLWLVAIVGKAVYQREAMGFGDVKLMGALGACFGWQATLFLVLFSALYGTLVGIVLIALNKKELTSRIPFGPYIALAALSWMFFGWDLVHWYLAKLTRGPM